MEYELAALARIPTQRIRSPLHAAALLSAIAGDLEPHGGDPLGRRRHRTAARRLAATAVLAAAGVHGAFGDRPGVDGARARVLAGVADRAGATEMPLLRAVGAVAHAALALPAIDDGGHADWQLGAIAFVDEELLRTLYAACVEVAAVALREAATGGDG